MKIILTSRCKKDLARCIKRGHDEADFKEVVKKIVNNSLDTKHRDHKLEGKVAGYIGARDCHIKPDWVLIYKKSNDALILVRTGSHSDLFD